MIFGLSFGNFNVPPKLIILIWRCFTNNTSRKNSLYIGSRGYSTSISESM